MSVMAQSIAVRALYAAAHSGIVIGLAGAGVMSTACLLLGGVPPLRLLVMAFCVSTSSYAVDRIVDLRRDTHLPRTQALQQLRGFAMAGTRRPPLTRVGAPERHASTSKIRTALP